MNSDYKDLIEEHCEHCYYNKYGVCHIARADMECVYGNLKHDLQELDLLRKLQKEHAKKLKALEIIKKKGVNIYLLNKTDNVEEYNELIKSHYGMKQLTREEYDFLKEVLL